MKQTAVKIRAMKGGQKVTALTDVRPELVLPGTEEPIRKVLAAMANNDDVRIFSEKW